MSLEISAQERPAIHYVGIPVTARLAEFGAPDGPNAMIHRVYQWLADHEIMPESGPLYIYRHVGAPGEPVDLTVAVAVAEPVKPTSGFVLGSLPAGTYVVGRHVGEPDQIPVSHAKVQHWAEANGHRLDVLRGDNGALWTGHVEHFLTKSTEQPDASKWHARHRAIEFKKFLQTLDREVPADLDVHVVLDNASTHKTPAFKRWLAAHPRFVLHFTPTSSSWLNLVERWFGELTTKKLQRGTHRSVRALNKDIRDWIGTWNDIPGPTSGPRPPTRSSIPSPATAHALTTHDTSASHQHCLITNR